MKIFKLDEAYSIVCEWQNTRYGFRHMAILHFKDKEIDRTKICYYNRTWESFEFQSVLEVMITKHFKDDEELRTKFLKKINSTNPFW